MNRFLLALVLPIAAISFHYPEAIIGSYLQSKPKWDIMKGMLMMDDSPVLINTCLITDHVNQLVQFYSNVLKIRAQRTGNTYAEFHTGVGVLAIFSSEAQENYIPHSAKPVANKSLILEFRVEDRDREYDRIKPCVKFWVKIPTTQPWGTRSMCFRDPDGNLVDFFELVKPKRPEH